MPTFHRPTTREQYLFVNQRPVRDKVLLSAVRGAYGDVLPSGRHPAVVLFLTVPPQEVDVNVHPTKAEVRFRDSQLVRGLIVTGIRHALQQGGQFTTSALAPQAFGMLQTEKMHTVWMTGRGVSRRRWPPLAHNYGKTWRRWYARLKLLPCAECWTFGGGCRPIAQHLYHYANGGQRFDRRSTCGTRTHCL